MEKPNSMSKKMLLILIFIFVIVFIFYCFYSYTNRPNNPKNVITIGSTKVIIELSDTPQKQAKGLSGRTELKDGYGMLFPYNPPQMASFWMKDMLIPIDIIFIKDNKIVTLYENVQPQPGTPPAQLKRYLSRQAIDFVLEVPARWCQKNNIQVGSSFSYLP